MKNLAKRWLKRLSLGISIAVVGILCLTLVALAIPGSVIDFIGTATDTTIRLAWEMASSSNSTVIRYATTTYPTSPTDGTSSHNGTGSYTTMTGLTAGTTYYFSAWGFDGSDYSTTETHLVLNTLPAVSENTTIPYNKPSIPSQAVQDPDTSGWSIDPIDDILSYFADPSVAHGGLGMSVNNIMMLISGVSVTFIGLLSYVRWRSFWTSWVIVIIGCGFCCTIGIMQWIVFGFLLLAGWGVWAVEKSTQ